MPPTTPTNDKLDIFLSRVLELELATPRWDIRSARYFHGKTNGLQIRMLLDKEGQFLLRESSSQEGQFVLSIYAQGQHLHFLVLKTSEAGKVRYSLGGDLFDSVRDLVDYHWKSGQPITKAMYVITEPVVRTSPIDQPRLIEYYEKNRFKTLDELITDTFLGLKSIKRFKIEEPSNVFFSTFTKHLEAGGSALDFERSNQIDEDFLIEQQLNIVGIDGAARWSEIIASHGPSVVSSHLFKADLRFVGINLEEDDNMSKSSGVLYSGLELILLPYGKQMRRDLITRNSSLRYFVLVTILKADSFRSRLEMLAKWIEVACEAKNSFGDYFAFGAVMSGLVHDILKEVDGLWSQMKQSYADLYRTFEVELKPIFLDLLNGKDTCRSEEIKFPFVIQICHLLEENFSFNPLVFKPDDIDLLLKPLGDRDHTILANFSLEDLLAHIELSERTMSSLNNFEARAREKVAGAFFRDVVLEEIFKTSHQVGVFFHQLRHRAKPCKLSGCEFKLLEEQLFSLI